MSASKRKRHVLHGSRSESRVYHNLVIAVAGSFGSGCTSLCDELRRTVEGWPGCHVDCIDVSREIETAYDKIFGMKVLSGSDPSWGRIERLQDAADRLRSLDNKIIGELICRQIHNKGKLLEAKGERVNSESKLHASRKAIDKDVTTLVFLVDSLKNVHDLEVLSTAYAAELAFVFVHADEQLRWKRMRNYFNWKQEDKNKFLERNNNEQNARIGNRDTFPHVGRLILRADYYVVNETNRESLQSQANRIFDLVMGFGTHQPTRDERNMHLAHSAATHSYCLARQVGAAVVDTQGNILGIGHNDVPKAGGGLYSSDGDDHRCYSVGNRRCINETNKTERFKQLAATLMAKKISLPNGKPLTEKHWLKLLSASPFSEAMEYCRAVHAEMEAILSIGRSSHGSTKGAWLYSTLEPCHNCTKHIVCAGIERVVFMEPYPRSLGDELHSDAVTYDGRQSTKQNSVQFCLYQGVAPSRYAQFFAKPEGVKEGKPGALRQKAKASCSDHPEFLIFNRSMLKSSRSNFVASHLSQNLSRDYWAPFLFEELRFAKEVCRRINGKKRERENASGS